MTETVTVPISVGTFERLVARTPTVPFHNRFVEQNPVLNESAITALARPAMKKFIEVGTGPGRSVFSAPGLFNDQLFVVSGVFLHTVNRAGVTSTVSQMSTIGVGDVSWAPVAPIGDGPARVFLTEGGILWVYTDDGEAAGVLQASGAALNGDQVVIDTVYYEFTNASVDAGTPDGTNLNPWLVDLGATTSAAFQNLYNAINAEGGTPGTDYSTAATAHPTVRATNVTAADLFVNARDPGVTGNTIATTETGANLAWGGGTLSGGGDEQLRQVLVPDDAGAVSVAHINGYVIVIPVQLEDLKTVGRFYWIDPGETFIDPLNFATAERSSDKVHQVRVYGNMFWLLGENTTEPWQTVGDPDAPMQRFQSILFDRGSWEGTAVQVKDSLIVVDEQGGVFQIAGGQKRISRPDIEERIRKAMLEEARLTF